MRNNQTTSIQPTGLPSTYTDEANYIGDPDVQHQLIKLFPTRTGRFVLVNLPGEPAITSFH